MPAKKTIAFIFTDFLWRSLRTVEDFHSGTSGIMDMGFYDAVYEEMSHCVFLYNGRLDDLPSDSALYILGLLKAVDKWDNPKKVKVEYDGDIARTLLGGKFLQFCRKGIRLDDEAMRQLNADIYNRIYTLVGMDAIKMIDVAMHEANKGLSLDDEIVSSENLEKAVVESVSKRTQV